MDKGNGTDWNERNDGVGENSSNGNGNGSGSGNTPDATTLKILSSRNMSTASLIAAPVSLFFGGVFLSIAALVFGIVALVKVNSVMHSGTEQQAYAQAMRVRAFIGIGISLVALVLNAIALAAVMPMIMELFNGGSLEDIMDSLSDSMMSDSSTTPSRPGLDGSGGESVFD